MNLTTIFGKGGSLRNCVWHPDDAILKTLGNLAPLPDDDVYTLSKKVTEVSKRLEGPIVGWAKIQAQPFAQQSMKSSWAFGIAKTISEGALKGLEETLIKQFPRENCKGFVDLTILRQQTYFLVDLQQDLQQTIKKDQMQQKTFIPNSSQPCKDAKSEIEKNEIRQTISQPSVQGRRMQH